MDPQFALAYVHLADQYFDESDLRRSNQIVIKVDQIQSRLPRYEQLSLQVLKADRSDDPEVQVRALQELIAEFPRDSFQRGA